MDCDSNGSLFLISNMLNGMFLKAILPKHQSAILFLPIIIIAIHRFNVGLIV